MQHTTQRGKILYLREGQETGREWFTITKHTTGHRTLRAHCEMDDHELLRDVTYSVGEDWKPRDAFVRLSLHDQFVGSSWFRFGERQVECEGFTVKEGRFSQHFDIATRAPSFGAHPICCDVWHLTQFDRRGPKQQILKGAVMSSPLPDGGSGPMIGIKDLNILYFGPETITVPAGTFTAEHFQFVLSGEHPGNEDVWFLLPDYIPLKIGYPIYNSTYELAELTEG